MVSKCTRAPHQEDTDGHISSGKATQHHWLREMQIKPQIMLHTYQDGYGFRSLTVPSAGEQAERPELFHVAHRNAESYKYLANQLGRVL